MNSQASNEVLTPASSLAAIFSAASLKSNAKPAQENLFGAPTNFKTPSSKKDTAESMVISSPLRLNIRSIFLNLNDSRLGIEKSNNTQTQCSPLTSISIRSAVTKSRGRSSKRKSSMRLTQSEGKKPAPLSDLFDDLESR